MSDRHSCAFTVIIHIQRGTRMRETRPAAAADGSKWPMFDFKDAHEIEYQFNTKAPTAAPTWKRK